MFKKILIPLDGSLLAEQALEFVKELLPNQYVELILLEAVGNPDLVYSVHGFGKAPHVQIRPESTLEDGEYIKSVVAETSEWAPHVEGFIKFDTAERAIVDVARQEAVDLIIMITHGYSGVERLLFSSVTEKVIRDVPCPILALRANHIPTHMLVALDGTPFSEAILDPAFELADVLDIDITLACVQTDEKRLRPSDVAEIRKFDESLANTVLYNHANAADIYLKSLHKAYSEKASRININLDMDVDHGRPGNRLPRLAERNRCDLIAMATHGRKGLDHLWNRSVTKKVMHQTNTAMLVLNPELENIPA